MNVFNFDGIKRDSIDASINAHSPIDKRLEFSGISNSLRLSQTEKVHLSIVVTLAGILILSMLISENASSPIISSLQLDEYSTFVSKTQ